MKSIETTLIQAGLEPIAAQIYLILIEHGELSPKAIATYTPLSRASIYEGLTELLAKEYIEYRKEGRNAYYKPAHPQILESLVAQKKREAALLEGEMKETIRSLTGSYNVSMHKPGVQFFDGLDGVKEALFDSLLAKDIVYTFIDANLVENIGPELAAEYRAARLKKQIPKKVIVHQSDKNSQYAANITDDITQVKLIPAAQYPFSVSVQIYDDTLSFIDLDEKKQQAFLIKSPAIVQFHKSLFEHTWNHL